MYEHEFYQVEKEIAAYNNIKLPETLKLDFKEPEYPKTVQDQIALDEHRLKHHMLDEVDLLMEYNNDLSRKEAEKIVEKNREAMEDEHLQAMKDGEMQEVEIAKEPEEDSYEDKD
jgi:hypothetical protein